MASIRDFKFLARNWENRAPFFLFFGRLSRTLIFVVVFSSPTGSSFDLKKCFSPSCRNVENGALKKWENRARRVWKWRTGTPKKKRFIRWQLSWYFRFPHDWPTEYRFFFLFKSSNDRLCCNDIFFSIARFSYASQISWPRHVIEITQSKRPTSLACWWSLPLVYNIFSVSFLLRIKMLKTFQTCSSYP